MLLISLTVIAFVWATAYQCSRFMFGGALLDTVATALFFASSILIAGLLLTGFVGQLRPIVTFPVIIALCAVVWLLTPHLPNLISAEHIPVIRIEASRFQQAALIVLLVIAVCLAIWRVIPLFNEAESATSIDVISFEMPVTVNFYQTQTVWNFEGRFSYYPYNYHLLLILGLWMTDNYALLPLFHLVSVIGFVLYTLLIGNWVLREHKPIIRILAGLVTICGLLLLHDPYFIWLVAKNDVYYGMLLLAAIYYWMRYWDETHDARWFYLLLVGLALGVGFGSKLTAVYWAAVLGGLHLFMLMRQRGWRIWQWWQVGLRHFLYVAIPFILFGGIWLLRSAIGYTPDAADAEFYALGWGNSIINLWHTPLLMMFLKLSLPVVIFAGLITLLLITPRVKMLKKFNLRVLGLFVWVSLLASIFFSALYIFLFHGLLALIFTVCGLLIIGHRSVPHIITHRVAILCGWLIVSGILFIVTPFSAWTVGTDYENPQQLIVQYRYIPTLFPLMIVLLAVVVTQVLEHETVSKTQRTVWKQEWHITPSIAAWIAALLFVGFAGGISGRAFTYEPLDTVTEETPANSGIYKWVTDNLHDTSMLVYVERQPYIIEDAFYPYLLYGDDLSNRVYYYTSYFASWAMDDVLPFIEERDIHYLLLPNDNEFAAYRDVYPVVFEDTYSLLFDTQTAQ